MVAVWSYGSTGPDGGFVRDEATRALTRGILVPVAIDPVMPPLGFGEVQALDLKRWKGNAEGPVPARSGRRLPRQAGRRSRRRRQRGRPRGCIGGCAPAPSAPSSPASSARSPPTWAGCRTPSAPSRPASRCCPTLAAGSASAVVRTATSALPGTPAARAAAPTCARSSTAIPNGANRRLAADLLAAADGVAGAELVASAQDGAWLCAPVAADVRIDGRRPGRRQDPRPGRRRHPLRPARRQRAPRRRRRHPGRPTTAALAWAAEPSAPSTTSPSAGSRPGRWWRPAA